MLIWVTVAGVSPSLCAISFLDMAPQSFRSFSMALRLLIFTFSKLIPEYTKSFSCLSLFKILCHSQYRCNFLFSQYKILLNSGKNLRFCALRHQNRQTCTPIIWPSFSSSAATFL
mgnify:CR=1 FL=1